ncbi:MAG: hypothetical protein AMXMBFR82_06100 [Candidatus Hydrogenedentota bacterium]
MILVAPLAVSQDADLDLDVFAIGTPRAGGAMHYEYSIKNLGPDPAENVTLRDFLPDEIEFIDAFLDPDGDGPINPQPLGITIGSGAMFCSLGDVPVTVDVPIFVFLNFRILPDVPDGTAFSNSADLFLSDTNDPDFSNNSDSTNINVQTTADVAIAATAFPNPVVAGDILTYDLGVSNLGLSDAQGVVVFAVLPDEAEALLGKSIPNCTQPPNLVGLRALLNGANEVPPAVAPTDPTGVATFVLNTDTNELIYSIEVSDITSDITLSHIHAAPAGVNGPVEVTLFSGGLDFDSTKPLVDSVTIAPAQTADLIANPQNYYVNVHTSDFPAGEIRAQLALTTNSPVRCEIGTVAADGEVAFELPALVDPNATPLGEIHNVAIVTSETDDDSGTHFNDIAATDTLVDTLADLQVTQVSAKSTTVQAGEVFTYSIYVDNFGPSFASGVAVGAVLESTGTFDLIDVTSDRDTDVSLTPGGGPFAVAGSALPPAAPPAPFGVNAPTGIADIDRHLEFTCDLTGGDDPLLAGSLGLLDSGTPPSTGRWTLIVRARARSAQTINSVVTVVSDTAETNTSNNQAVDMVSVLNTADLEITKTATAGPVIPGDTITYDITVTNLGPSPAADVVIQDNLPAGVEVVSVSGLTPGGGAAACVGGTPGNPLDPATCFLGTVLAGESGSMSIEVRVGGDIPLDPLTGDRILHNAARVSSATFDPVNANNLAGTFTTVECAILAAPTGLTASDGTEFHSVILTWDAVPGAVEYAVYRNSINDFGTADRLATVVGTTYVDLEPFTTGGFLSCNQGNLVEFTYWVAAVNTCGESDPSAPDVGFENPAKSASLVPSTEQAGDLAVIGGLLMALALFRVRQVRRSA